MTVNLPTSCPTPRTSAAARLEVALPEPGQTLSQDTEWCVVRVGEEWRQIRFHDYSQLFSVPGLYEKVIYDILKCCSPRRVCRLLAGELAAAGQSAETLRVLDVGAGNGMVGAELAELGVGLLVGVDIIPEAARAAERDYPGTYHDYLVLDLGRLDERRQRELGARRFNCLACVAALGFGDIPTQAFVNAFNLVEQHGWVAFNIKEEFLEQDDLSGFALLVHSMVERGVLEITRRVRYPHRLATSRDPIHYVALVGRKRRDLPDPS